MVMMMVMMMIFQLMGLLRAKGKDGDRARFTQLVGATASEMTARYKAQFQEHFHQPLLGPLSHCLQSQREGVGGRLVVSEEDLTRCLEETHRVRI